MIITSLIHFLSICFCIVITALGVSISQAITAKTALEAINRQPDIKTDINRATLLGLAIIETAALLGFIGSILLFLYKTNNIYDALAQVGFTVAISLPGFMIGIASAMPTKSALLSIARQPFINKKIMNFMLLTQSLIQTPLAFGFIIALLIRTFFGSITTFGQVNALIASGLCIALGCIGPALGVGRFAQQACYNIGINKAAYTKLLSFTFISQAIIETPVIFSAIISFWLIRIGSMPIENTLTSFAYLAAAFVMGIGTLGPGISSGRTAAAACDQIALNPQNYGSLARTSMLGQGIIDTSAIYAFIISISIILGTL